MGVEFFIFLTLSIAVGVYLGLHPEVLKKAIEAGSLLFGVIIVLGLIGLIAFFVFNTWGPSVLIGAIILPFSIIKGIKDRIEKKVIVRSKFEKTFWYIFYCLIGVYTLFFIIIVFLRVLGKY